MRATAEVNRARILEYLRLHPCVDCGEADPIVLEFDHRENKKAAIGEMFCTYSWSAMKREIEKCDVRCVNCHRRKTARDFKWTRRAAGA